LGAFVTTQLASPSTRRRARHEPAASTDAPRHALPQAPFKPEPITAVTNRRIHDDLFHRLAAAVSHSPSSIGLSSTSPHPDEDYDLEHPNHIELEHHDVFSGCLHRIDVSMDIDA
jgi:hypothetical protein